MCTFAIRKLAADDVAIETYCYGAFGSRTLTHAPKIGVMWGTAASTLTCDSDFESSASYGRDRQKGSPYSITERRVPELIPVLCCLVNRGTSSLPKTVTRQRRGCDLNSDPSAPESSN